MAKLADQVGTTIELKGNSDYCHMLLRSGKKSYTLIKILPKIILFYSGRQM